MKVSNMAKAPEKSGNIFQGKMLGYSLRQPRQKFLMEHSIKKVEAFIFEGKPIENACDYVRFVVLWGRTNCIIIGSAGTKVSLLLIILYTLLTLSRVLCTACVVLQNLLWQ